MIKLLGWFQEPLIRLFFYVNGGVAHGGTEGVHLFTSYRCVVSGMGTGWFFHQYCSCQPASLMGSALGF
jgi:hypothetical protein